MGLDRSTLGLRWSTHGGDVGIASARPGLVVRVGGKAHTWQPEAVEVAGEALRASGGPGGCRLDLVAFSTADDAVTLDLTVTNEGPEAVHIERVEVLRSSAIHVGGHASAWRCYRNGYQSWSGTHTLGADEADRDFRWRFARVGSTDARHRAPHEPGRIRSDALSAICDAHAASALGFGFGTLADVFCFVEIDAAAQPPQLVCWADFDGTTLAPGDSTAKLTLHLVAEHGDREAGWRALQRVARACGDAMAARGRDQPHPAGWCSWYYYFEKVTEQDVVENLDVLAADGPRGPKFGCEYVMVDDGHQAEIGDWLDTHPAKFPSGMSDLARRIGSAGFDAGIWWAPFFAAPRSKVALAHPDWLVRKPSGRPITGLINPAWGITKPMRVLDTTHPEVLAHLTATARHIGVQWGYRIQKLDFLYAAALPGIRHDRGATRAQSLRRGLEAIRRGAGEEAFLLGCGCPLGPAIGVVDAMRIGADVTPYWTNWLARHVLLDTHGLATRHAVMNTLTRAVVDGAWWLNDPDCLMLRDSETRLNEEEVRLMATVFAMTNGMIVLSDRLTRLPEARLDLLRRARHLAGGRPTVVDLFDGPVPGILTAEHADRVDVAALNLTDAPLRRRIDVAPLVREDGDGDRYEYWTGAPVPVRDGVADFGELPPHAARVLSFARA